MHSDLEAAIECDATLYSLHSRSYFAARRTSFITLPCFAPHYPNTQYYPVPAQLLPGVRFQRPKTPQKSLFGVFFGKKIPQSSMVLPVGRKPTADQLYKHNQFIIQHGELKALERVKIAGYADSESEDSDVEKEVNLRDINLNLGRLSGGSAISNSVDGSNSVDSRTHGNNSNTHNSAVLSPRHSSSSTHSTLRHTTHSSAHSTHSGAHSTHSMHAHGVHSPRSSHILSPRNSQSTHSTHSTHSHAVYNIRSKNKHKHHKLGTGVGTIAGMFIVART